MGGNPFVGKLPGKDLAQFVVPDFTGIAAFSAKGSQGVYGVGRRSPGGQTLLPGMGRLVDFPGEYGIDQGHAAAGKVELLEEVIAGKSNHHIDKGISDTQDCRGIHYVLHGHSFLNLYKNIFSF